ncbi:hypothetical protein [Azospirillum agricola]|uniref:hypothetical protein n=1 Tax=Azospirillum agricola TaxID=1720247 RepID=UPI000A0F3BF0|nr:hypothetical protein [Azospirillum agricola]MBP2228475.1 hypothetical protein [Azospirillum agricola]SMH34383.1 hypothetical protein SAMN02982994_0758 [Azospirillum lipoferum]
MAFKPNYNQQRAERNRAKEQKKQEKLQRREEEVAARRAAGLPPDLDSEVGDADKLADDAPGQTDTETTGNG